MPAIEDPKFSLASAYSFPDKMGFFLGIKLGDQVKAYPISILNWHEAVNDRIDDYYYSISYCPLTGSGIVWDRSYGEDVNGFGVTGLLYNSNLILYDRLTNSHWSQMKMQSVRGDRAGEIALLYPLVEMTWEAWQAMFPGSSVLNTQTGYSRPYGQYPYDDYRENNDLLMVEMAHNDGRLPGKTRIHGIIHDDQAVAFLPQEFPDSIAICNSHLFGEPILIGGSGAMGCVISYYRTMEEDVVLEFKAVQEALPVIMTDNEGNLWNIFGEAIGGPRAGSCLRSTRCFNAYWFAWAAFYPHTEIKNFQELNR
ncbi:DUF3179 domain-containing protein [bacterium]|nr:DUF3179 domain-containing protein [bacterium]